MEQWKTVDERTISKSLNMKFYELYPSEVHELALWKEFLNKINSRRRN